MNILKATLLVVFVTVLCQPKPVQAQEIAVIISKNGSFDIVGKSIKIIHCYPALDNKLLQAISVKIYQKHNTQTIAYNLAKGKVVLKFKYQAGTLAINTEINGLDTVPSLINLVSKAQVVGATQIYRTPVVIGGGAGIVKWPNIGDKSLKCESITGLIPDKGNTMVISTRDYKKYISHLLLSTLDTHKKIIDVNIETEKVATSHLPTYYFTENTVAYNAMKNEAQAAANFMGAKTDKPQSYHWCSWYYTYYHLTQQMVSDYLKGFKTLSPLVNIKTFQIDAGYHPHLGDWLEPSFKFPNGIEASVKEIIANGYEAGIWIGPYMVGNRSKLFAEHPDWILRKKDGKPIIQMTFYGEDRLWGLIDEETYVLDTSNPAVMDYLRNVFRTFKKMGISFFKTDFMYYGWESSNNVKRYNPGKTSSEYQRAFFDMIREEIGQDAFWLGCIAPFPVMLGYVDGMRMAGDIGPKWDAATGMFNEMKGAQHLNNVWWQNDADALIIREKYSNLTHDETITIAYWVAMLGGVINTSDLFHEIPKDRLELFRFLEPGYIKYNSYQPFLGKNPTLEVVVKTFPEKNSFAVLIINRNNETTKSDFSLNDLIGIKSGTCYRWGYNKSEIIGQKEHLTIELKPHESCLIYVSADGKSPDEFTLGGKKNNL